jgi:hypothetical protein
MFYGLWSVSHSYISTERFKEAPASSKRGREGKVTVPDLREELSGRLERAADRMCNSGFLDEERRYRDAAAEVRAGLSLEDMQAIEQRMLVGRRPGQQNRLSALAAQGEYDGPGGIDAGAGSALGDALDESIVTDNESGASQLLSTAASNGLSDPYSSAQAGWVATPESVDPYTDIAGAGSDDGSAFTGGQSVDPYTNAAPTDDNPNGFSGGQNVNPLTGDENTDPFNTSDTQSLLSSPYLLAQNDVPNQANANLASDAGGQGYAPPAGGLTWTGFDTDYAGTNYYTYVTSDGSTIWYNPETGTFSQPQVDIVGTIYPPGAPIPLPPDFVPEDPTDTTPVPTTPNTQSTGAPATPSLDPQLTPEQEAQLNAAIQQAVGSSDPTPVNAPVDAGQQNQPVNQPGSPAGETVAQQDEANWSAAKSGMWDSLVDLGQGLLTLALNPGTGPFGPLQPSLDWAKSGPPAPTGDRVRDAQLLDNYVSGGWVTTTVSFATPFAAEGLLDSALVASTKLPALEGLGIGGGGRLIGPTEQWLASFGETTESLAPTLENGLAEETTAVQNLATEQGSFIQIARPDSESMLQQALWSGREYSYRGSSIIVEEFRIGNLNFDGASFTDSGALKSLDEFKWDYSGSIASGNVGVADRLVEQATEQLEVADRLGIPLNWHVQAAQESAFRNVLGSLANRINFLPY